MSQGWRKRLRKHIAKKAGSLFRIKAGRAGPIQWCAAGSSICAIRACSRATASRREGNTRADADFSALFAVSFRQPCVSSVLFYLHRAMEVIFRGGNARVGHFDVNAGSAQRSSRIDPHVIYCPNFRSGFSRLIKQSPAIGAQIGIHQATCREWEWVTCARADIDIPHCVR